MMGFLKISQRRNVADVHLQAQCLQVLNEAV